MPDLWPFVKHVNSAVNFFQSYVQRFAAFGGLEVELPRRDAMRQAPEFAE